MTSRLSLGLTGAREEARQLLADQRPGDPPMHVALMINGRIVFAGQLEEILISSANGQLSMNVVASDQLQRVEESAARRLEAAAKEAPKP